MRQVVETDVIMSRAVERVDEAALETETFKSILGSRETFHSVHSVHSGGHSIHSSSDDIRDDHVDDDRLGLPVTPHMPPISNATSARSLAEGLPKVVITQPSDASLLERKRARTLSDTSNVADSDTSDSCWCCCCSGDKEDGGGRSCVIL